MQCNDRNYSDIYKEIEKLVLVPPPHVCIGDRTQSLYTIDKDFTTDLNPQLTDSFERKN